MANLLVIQPFANYTIGSVISDANAIANALSSNPAQVKTITYYNSNTSSRITTINSAYIPVPLKENN